ncbi:MAG: hypothetical protein IKN63_03990 [Bacilli bacterium]|nr:hypothetical protein [Bacilli bacterium]
MDKKIILKWENEYIHGVNLENIEWIKLNNIDLRKFYEENYLDRKLWQYVSIKSGIFNCPFGLYYLTIDAPSSLIDYNYLLGIVDNKIGKKTIVADMIYYENYHFFGEKIKPMTYISTVEVNHYFRSKGIFKKLCEEVINFINQDNNIMVSPESEMGKIYNTFEIFKNILMEKGFKKCIWNERTIKIYELYDYLLKNEKENKVLKKGV